jgi:hypothetical protein
VWPAFKLWYHFGMLDRSIAELRGQEEEGAVSMDISNIDAPWTTWWQSDIPCQFSQTRALENKNFRLMCSHRAKCGSIAV